jgi:small subunit ribosomal protein S3
MIERKFVAQNIRELEIKEYLYAELGKVGLSNVKLQKTPLGEKILVSASRPGLVVGKGGANIARLTRELKEKFSLENPQIEIEEVTDPRGNAAITAEVIANSLERYGPVRFKGIGHKAISTIMDSGAHGVEILISGKIPSARAKTWRFYQGYLKKCGDISIAGVDKSKQVAKLKSGVVGIQVNVMPITTSLPDKITFKSEEQVKQEKEDAVKREEEKKEAEEKKPAKKKAVKKRAVKKKAAKKNASKKSVGEK